VATLTVACASAVLGSGATRAVVVSVLPRDVLFDQPVSISVSGLAPRAPVLLTATTTDASGARWRSRALFRADAAGNVVVARSRSLAGTYVGRDAAGLLWSMEDVGSTVPRAEQTLEPATVSTVHVDATVSGRLVGSGSFTRRLRTPGVSPRRTSLVKEGFVGCYWSPTSAGRERPAILRFGGSEGGLDCGSGLLSSHGYPELDIGYFALPGLPQTLERIPLEYFEKALRWLASRPGVDPHRIVVWGTSRGGEAAFLLATTYPQLVHAVVDYVGGNVVYGSSTDIRFPAWTLHGKPIAPGTVVPIQRISGPLFMVGAWDDRLFASGAKVETMGTELAADGKHDFTALAYPGAGHGIGAAVPNLPVALGVYVHDGVPYPLGGTIAGNARAREDSWPRLLAFLHRL
jgi:dienelactone hydrolase